MAPHTLQCIRDVKLISMNYCTKFWDGGPFALCFDKKNSIYTSYTFSHCQNFTTLLLLFPKETIYFRPETICNDKDWLSGGNVVQNLQFTPKISPNVRTERVNWGDIFTRLFSQFVHLLLHSYKSKRYRDKLRSEIKALEDLLPVDRTSVHRKLDSQTVFRLVIAFFRTKLFLKGKH